MKKILSILICITLIFIFYVSSFAVVPYSSVTEDSSQVKILLEYMLNCRDFNFTQEWIIFRYSENEYHLYFNKDEDENAALFVRYMRSSNYQNNIWYISDDHNYYVWPSVDMSNYSAVGSIDGSLGSSLYRQYVYDQLLKASILIITFVFILYVFRVKRRI